MSAHTQEPWVAGTLTECHMIYDHKLARHIARLAGTGNAEANAQRIVASVNALAGIDDPAKFRANYDAVRKALEAIATGMPSISYKHSIDEMRMTAKSILDATAPSGSAKEEA